MFETESEVLSYTVVLSTPNGQQTLVITPDDIDSYNILEDHISVNEECLSEYIACQLAGSPTDDLVIFQIALSNAIERLQPYQISIQRQYEE